MTTRQGAIRPGTTLLLCIIGAATLGCGIRLLNKPLDDSRIQTQQLDYYININTADEAQLLLLPGIGSTIARRIVNHRTQRGPFASIDALGDVGGIGPKTIARLRPFVRM